MSCFWLILQHNKGVINVKTKHEAGYFSLEQTSTDVTETQLFLFLFAENLQQEIK